jgi:hypothetical protein
MQQEKPQIGQMRFAQTAAWDRLDRPTDLADLVVLLVRE